MREYVRIARTMLGGALALCVSLVPVVSRGAETRDRLDGWGKIKFGMSRAEVLAIGGPNHYSSNGNAELNYDMDIGGKPYVVTAIVPSGYVEGVVVASKEISALAHTEAECFEMTRSLAAEVASIYGQWDETKTLDLSGTKTLSFIDNYRDGNTLQVFAMFGQGSCRSVVTYQGPKKMDKGNF